DGAGDDAPGLAGADGKVVVGVLGAAGDGVFAVVGVADGVVVIDLVAAAGEEAALVHLDDVADALEHPLDTAGVARRGVVVVDGGDDDVLGADRVGGLDWADFQPAGVRVEVGEIAGADRLGVGADDVLGAAQVGEVARVVRHAEAAGRQPEGRRQQCPGPAL